MAGFNIETFKQTIKTVARPTLFTVTINGPAVQALNTDLLQFTCKTTTLPSDTVGKIEVPFYGRKVFFPGDRNHDDWNTTIFMDKDYTLWRQLYTWKQNWNHSIQNTATSNNALDYKADGLVQCFDQTGQATLSVRLVGLFPYMVQPLPLGWENQDQTADLEVTWFFDYVDPNGVRLS